MSASTRPPVWPSPKSPRAGRPTAARQQHRRLLLRIGAVAAVAIAVLFLITRAGGEQGSSSSGGPAYAVGQPGPGAPAPTFTLPSTAGGSFDLAAQRGKTVLLYFHEGLGCQPCWDQIRDVEKRWSDFTALGIDQLVAIAGDPLDQLRQKASDERLATPVLADPDLSLGGSYQANRYGMMGTSTYGRSFVVVGPDGIIRWRADYGGEPKYTTYVRPAVLLEDLRAGLSRRGS